MGDFVLEFAFGKLSENCPKNSFYYFKKDVPEAPPKRTEIANKPVSYEENSGPHRCKSSRLENLLKSKTHSDVLKIVGEKFGNHGAS